MNSVKSFVELVNQVTRLPINEQPVQLLKNFTLDASINPYIVQLNNLPDIDDNVLDELVQSSNIYNGEWLAFNEVLISFIKLSNQLNAWSLLESFDLYSQYINDLSIAFNNNNRGYLLVLLVKDTVDIIIPMATKLDYQLYYKENCMKPRLTYIAAILLKIFNNIRSQVGGGDHSELIKKSIILYMGIKLCQVYFKIGSPLLCRNIFSNMNNAQLNFNKFPINQQIQYRFYLGKFYLIKNEFIDSYQHLFWCLTKCPSNLKDHENVTRILKLLIPISMIIGRIPKFDVLIQTFYSNLLKVPSYFRLYQQIMHAIQLGDFSKFNMLLSQPDNYEFLKDLNILIPISSKGNLLVLRNLVKRVWIIGGHKNKLEFDELKVALKFSLSRIPPESFSMNKIFQYFEINDLTIENIFITLIDQNFIKGKLFPRLRGVSLSKTNVFPSVAPINFVKYGHGSEGKLNRSDNWMIS